jgi:hypothetical protein
MLILDQGFLIIQEYSMKKEGNKNASPGDALNESIQENIPPHQVR